MVLKAYAFCFLINTLVLNKSMCLHTYPSFGIICSLILIIQIAYYTKMELLNLNTGLPVTTINALFEESYSECNVSSLIVEITWKTEEAE